MFGSVLRGRDSAMSEHRADAASAMSEHASLFPRFRAARFSRTRGHRRVFDGFISLKWLKRNATTTEPNRGLVGGACEHFEVIS